VAMIPTSAKNKAPPERTLDERDAGGRMSVPGLGRVKTIRRLRAVEEVIRPRLLRPSNAQTASTLKAN